MTEHTPRPWRVVITDAAGRHVLVHARHSSIARISANLHRKGNARLIAAAPDLLAALEDARAQLESYEHELSGKTFNDTRINAAIAKAKEG